MTEMFEYRTGYIVLCIWTLYNQIVTLKKEPAPNTINHSLPLNIILMLKGEEICMHKQQLISAKEGYLGWSLKDSLLVQIFRPCIIDGKVHY